jgi:hypothetical protein
VKAFLLYADRDLDMSASLPEREPDLAADLELDVLLTAMARGDQYLYDIARAALQASLQTPEQIRYRQDILSDCLRHPDAVLAVYNLTTVAIAAERKIYSGLFTSPSYTLHRSMEVMTMFLGVLRQLRAIAAQQDGRFASAGFVRLFDMLRIELDDSYLAEIEAHLRTLKFRNGLLESARLDSVNKPSGFVLRRPPGGRSGLRGLLQSGDRRPSYSLVVADRDVTGQQTLSRLRDRGVDLVADALAQSCEHIRSFLDMLRRETGFYLGCLNLHEEVTSRGYPLCLPAPLAPGKQALTAAGLYDAALALTTTEPVAGNDLSADGKALLMITGANQGGKSTFLRSLGQAQLMMQAGMFVAAEEFTANVCGGVYTHYKRAEDASMTSGKLDEELARMSDITATITPRSLLLCNESFASTNEREGSHIARNITNAMLDCGVKVAFVTHFYELAYGFAAQERDDALFLRADRAPDGSRTFRLIEGAPQLTSFARDIYLRIFGEPLDAADALPQTGATALPTTASETVDSEATAGETKASGPAVTPTIVTETTDGSASGL